MSDTPKMDAAFRGWEAWMCYRCHPHGKPFTGKVPQCPVCGAEAPAVSAAILVHFLFQDNAGGIVGEHGVRWRMACQPDLKQLVPWVHHSSGEAGATTCPKCKATKEWQDADGADKVARMFMGRQF